MTDTQYDQAVASRRTQTRAEWYAEAHPAFAELCQRWSAGQRASGDLAPLLLQAVDLEAVSHAHLARSLGITRSAVTNRVAHARRYAR